MKYAIVTGGTSGIGLGVAKMLLSKGYHVFATHVGPAPTERLDHFEAIATDQGLRTEVYRFVDYVRSQTTHVDCIVCNAGMSIRRAFMFLPPPIRCSRAPGAGPFSRPVYFAPTAMA